MSMSYHLKRECDHLVLAVSATGVGIASIHRTLARLHREIADRSPDILSTIELGRARDRRVESLDIPITPLRKLTSG